MRSFKLPPPWYNDDRNDWDTGAKYLGRLKVIILSRADKNTHHTL